LKEKKNREDEMNVFQRFLGVIFNPQPTFQFLAQKPVWLDALIVLLLFSAFFSYLTYPYSQQDNLQAFQDNKELRERVGEKQFNQMVESMQNPTPAQRTIATVMGPVSIGIGFLISSLVILILGRMTSTQGHFNQIFSVYLHANFVDKVIGYGIKLPLIYMTESIVQTTTSLALFFPTLEVTSSAFIILSQFDLFQIWLFGILAFGLAAVFKISLKKALVVSYGFFLIKALLYIGLGLLAMQFMS
jgi:hypothetical protein